MAVPVATLGPTNSGKTVFLTLLYSAQREYGALRESDEKSFLGLRRGGEQDEFRFATTASANSFLQGNLNMMLGQGRMPPHSERGVKPELSFLYGFRRIPKLAKRGGLGKLPYKIIHFSTWDVAGGDISDYVDMFTKHGPSGNPGDQEIAKLLDCDSFVLILDCDAVTPDLRSTKGETLLEYDRSVTTMLLSIIQYRKTRSRAGDIYPVLVFSKFDVAHESLQKAGFAPRPPKPKQGEDRYRYAMAFLARFFPGLHAQIRGGLLRGIAFDDAYFMFSYVNWEAPQGGATIGGTPKLALVQDNRGGGGQRLDYPFEEYEGFIKHFRRISGKLEGSEVESFEDAARRAHMVVV